MIPALLIAASVAAASPSHARKLDPRHRPSDEEIARFEFLRRRKREADGYITRDGDRNEEHPRRAPEGMAWSGQSENRTFAAGC